MPSMKRDPRTPAGPRPAAEKRELHLLVVALAVLVVIGCTLYGLISRPPAPPAPEAGLAEAPLAPMRMPELAALAVPPPGEVVAQAAAAQALLDDGGAPPMAGPLDALAVAWAGAALVRDSDRPPVPQRVTPRELVGGAVAPGTPLMLAARLDDSRRDPAAGDEAPTWLRLALEDGQYAVALAPPSAATIDLGIDLQVVGRLVGVATVPAEGGGQALPFLALRSLTPTPKGGAELLTSPELAEYHSGRLVMPPDLYDGISDERPLLETRPYYYALGQTKLDRSTPGVFDQARSANQEAHLLHKDPSRFRGQVFSVRGIVLQAWEDVHVAQDRPFEVTRVVRVILAHSDWGPFTELVRGVEQTNRKLVRRLYELAVVGDQPLPPVGALVTATGRFLKFRAIPVPTDRERDRLNQVIRQSNFVFTMLFTVPEYRVVPPPVRETPWWTIGGFAAVGLVVAVAIVVRGRSRPQARTVRDGSLEVRRARARATAEPATPAPPPVAAAPVAAAAGPAPVLPAAASAPAPSPATETPAPAPPHAADGDPQPPAPPAR